MLPPPDPRQTTARLGAASLLYLLGMTLVVTLTPFRFAAAPVHGFTAEWSWTDVVMNVLMFMPMGFMYALARPRARYVVVEAFLVGLAVSAVIEFAQLFEAERFTSVLDIATNGAGALLGGIARDLFRSRRGSDAGTRRALGTLELELPLAGLVYLLVPLQWLVSLGTGDSARPWLALLVAMFGGAIIGAVHGAYVRPRRGASGQALVVAAAGWAMIAGVMLLRRDAWMFVVTCAACVTVAMLHSAHAGRPRARRNRRFEVPTLRAALPFFAAYLALSALWPLDGADLAWRGGIGFFPAGAMPVDVAVYRALEHIAAFTLVGYVVAEVRGRTDQPYGAVLPLVLVWGTALALLLEVTRGVHPLYGASALMLALSVLAAVFGGWMYHLQRDHVRALASHVIRSPVDARRRVQPTVKVTPRIALLP